MRVTSCGAAGACDVTRQVVTAHAQDNFCLSVA